MPNLFEFPSSLPEQEVFDPLLHHPNVCIERIISTGQITPPGEWYDQNQDEWVILIQGQAELAYDDGSRLLLNPGDYLFIPAHQKHRIEYTSTAPPCIWLAIHLSSPEETSNQT
jgi:cupin 2 domain-containing protein